MQTFGHPIVVSCIKNFKFILWEKQIKCFSSFNRFLLNAKRRMLHRPANICWSSRRLQDMSWRCLQHFFSVTVFRLPRRLENVLKTSHKTSWRRLGRQKIVTLKTSWRRLEDMSWRCLEDVLERSKMFTGDICI